MACCLIVFGTYNSLAQPLNPNILPEYSISGLDQMLQFFDEEWTQIDVWDTATGKCIIPPKRNFDQAPMLHETTSLLSRSDMNLCLTDAACGSYIFVNGPPKLFFLISQFKTYA